MTTFAVVVQRDHVSGYSLLHFEVLLLIEISGIVLSGD